ncbi:MAG: sugar ABC transporter ATP-binding protein [Spirochaetia bacterium]|nr:sugar ABC transporter ATP-binding protein [Spirochaetia bacterium]
MTPILEIINISKTFPGVRALDQVSMIVEKGQIHAVMGENGAGKSTLMKCIFGLYKQDEGEILLEGNPCNFTHPKEALHSGISMIHQELQNIPTQSVMENIWIGRIPYKGKNKHFRWVDEEKMYQDTVSLFESLDLDINPKAMLKDLSVSTCQLIEIARSVSYNSKLIIMDEPTSSLTESESKLLFNIIKKLVKQDVSILYISHKLEEVLELSHHVTILRDGQLIGNFDTKKIDSQFLVNKMVGRKIVDRFPKKDSKQKLGDVRLKISDFSSLDNKSFKNISFEVKQGEILGIGGLVGAGRTELIESIFGLRAIKSGTIEIDGKELNIKSSRDAIRNGLTLLTEERAKTGIISKASILDNMMIVKQRYKINEYQKLKVFLNDKKRREDTKAYVDSLSVKTPTIDTNISNLSGGNQQKVLLGRWLMVSPEILILDEPTRGIDVGAKFEIYSIMRELSAQGKTIIMISSEMPELMGMSDRIMVMCEGHLSGIIDGPSATEEKIMLLASRYEEKE